MSFPTQDDLLDRCKPLNEEGAFTNPAGRGQGAYLETDFCRRCFKPIEGRRRFCSYDCEMFAPQASFDVMYKQLHPEWPEVRGTRSTLLA